MTIGTTTTIPTNEQIDVIVGEARAKLAQSQLNEAETAAFNKSVETTLSTGAAPVAEDGVSKSVLSQAIANVTAQEEVAVLMNAHNNGKLIVGRVDRSHIFDAGTLMTLNKMRQSMREVSLGSLFNELTVKAQLIPHGVDNDPEDYLYMAAIASELYYRRKVEVNPTK